MITYTIDILILVSVLAGLIGLWVGVMFGYWINKSAIEQDKPKKPIPLKDIEWIYKCPNCNGILTQEREHCHKCGQKLDFRGVGNG